MNITALTSSATKMIMVEKAEVVRMLRILINSLLPTTTIDDDMELGGYL